MGLFTLDGFNRIVDKPHFIPFRVIEPHTGGDLFLHIISSSPLPNVGVTTFLQVAHQGMAPAAGNIHDHVAAVVGATQPIGNIKKVLTGGVDVNTHFSDLFQGVTANHLNGGVIGFVGLTAADIHPNIVEYAFLR